MLMILRSVRFTYPACTVQLGAPFLYHEMRCDSLFSITQHIVKLLIVLLLQYSNSNQVPELLVYASPQI